MPVQARALTALLALAACSSGPGPDPSTTVTLSGHVQPILTQNCALSGCHLGPNAQLGQDLSVGNTFVSVVNVPSIELPSMNRVTPGDPENSYLVHKIRGTHEDVGGSGGRMPLGKQPLREDQILLIVNWIQLGADNN